MIPRGWLERRAGWLLLAFALGAPVLFYGAYRAARTNTNKVEDWLPDSFEETRELAWFREHFAADQFVVVTWDGCDLGGDPRDPGATSDDPRIERVARALAPAAPLTPATAADDSQAPPLSAKAAGAARFFQQVATGRRAVEALTAAPSNLDYAEAIDRLRGFLVGPDGQQTCIVATLSREAQGRLREVVGRGRRGGWLRLSRPEGALMTLLRECGVEPDEARLGGPPIDNVAIDEEGERSLIRLAALSALLGLGLAWWSLRSFKLTLIVFAAGLQCAAAGMAAVWATGATMDAILLSMPSLVYVLAISGSVHVINHYRDAVDEHGLEHAPSRAVAHAWRPALICSTTTALGLLSLYTSELEPIRKFGLYSAIGVMSTLLVLFFYVPAALTWWPMPVRRRSGEDASTGGDPKSQLVEVEHPGWAWFGGAITRRHGWVTAACCAVILGVSCGLGRVETSIDLLKLFDPSARILQDYAWLESHLGRLVPMEIVLRIPAADCESVLEGGAGATGEARSVAMANGGPPREARLTFLQRMEIAARIQQIIESRLGEVGAGVVGRTMSAATFAPDLPGLSGDTFNFARRSATNKRLEASRAAFEATGFLRTDAHDDAELWRVSLRVAAFAGVDYAHFVRDLRNSVEPVVAAAHARERVLAEVARSRQAATDGDTANDAGDGPDRDGVGLAGAQVLVWQWTEPGQDSAERRVFGETLLDMIEGARVELLTAGLDPDGVSLTQLDELAEFDTVVLCGDFSEADEAMIRHATTHVVRVDYLGEPSESSAAAMAGAASKPPIGEEGAHELAAVYTGVVPIVYKAQRVLLNSLIESTVWSFLTITPLMMFVCRGFWAGLVVMVPNVLPVVMVFGGMGWLSVPVDIGSMMSASIALGVAVDDTIHFLSFFRDDLDRLRDRRRAILAAYQRCATPTLQAALISGLGLSVFASSTFTPTQRFGWLMLTILITGVVAELVMLPAILAGPLGAVLRPRGAQLAESPPPSPESARHEPAAEPAPASPENSTLAGPHRSQRRSSTGSRG